MKCEQLLTPRQFSSINKKLEKLGFGVANGFVWLLLDCDFAIKLAKLIAKHKQDSSLAMKALGYHLAKMCEEIKAKRKKCIPKKRVKNTRRSA